MRIAIIGAFGSGKTSLSSAMSATSGIPIAEIPAMDSPLAAPGKHATRCTHDELIELLVRRVLDRGTSEESAGGRFISDGSLLHDWVFVHTLLRHGTHPDASDPEHDPTHSGPAAGPSGSLEAIRRALAARVRGRYDLIAYLPIEFPMEVTAAPISEGFRHLSDRYLRDQVEQLQLPFHTIVGAPQRRLDHLNSLITGELASSGSASTNSRRTES